MSVKEIPNLKTITETEVELAVQKKCQKLEVLFADFEKFDEIISGQTMCYDYETFGDKYWFDDFKSFDSYLFEKLSNDYKTNLEKKVIIPVNQKTISGDKETTVDKIIAIDLYHEKLQSILAVIEYMDKLYTEENQEAYTGLHAKLTIDITLVNRQIRSYELLRKALVYFDKLETRNRLDCIKNGVEVDSI